VSEGDLTWEIDQFLDRELVLAEVELRSADITPAIPAWLAPRMIEDVTERGEYTNLALAR
jgi:CYTH domain-containing protein